MVLARNGARELALEVGDCCSIGTTLDDVVLNIKEDMCRVTRRANTVIDLNSVGVNILQRTICLFNSRSECIKLFAGDNG